VGYVKTQLQNTKRYQEKCLGIFRINRNLPEAAMDLQFLIKAIGKIREKAKSRGETRKLNEALLMKGDWEIKKPAEKQVLVCCADEWTSLDSLGINFSSLHPP
jgi:hypothetical protein